jgi:hypothetical protein
MTACFDPSTGHDQQRKAINFFMDIQYDMLGRASVPTLHSLIVHTQAWNNADDDEDSFTSVQKRALWRPTYRPIGFPISSILPPEADICRSPR